MPFHYVRHLFKKKSETLKSNVWPSARAIENRVLLLSFFPNETIHPWLGSFIQYFLWNESAGKGENLFVVKYASAIPPFCDWNQNKKLFLSENVFKTNGEVLRFFPKKVSLAVFACPSFQNFELNYEKSNM